jgi:hypothetical protein
VTGRRAGGDTGASMVLALALTTFLGLLIGALLSYTGASVRATKAADTRAGRTYDADGALKTAVNQIRAGTFNNDPGVTCPGLTVPGGTGTTVAVTCAARTGSGAGSELVPVTAANRPAQAVLTLGTNSGEAGVAQRSTGALRVRGPIASSGTVDAGTGSVESLDAQITARGACTGTVLSRNAAGATVANACSAAATPADPNYPEPTAGLTYRPLPTCDSTSTVEFLPGYYDDAVGLTAMTSGTGACAGKTFLFRSATGGGVYHFDFHNGESPALPTGPRVWTINDAAARFVGGTPLGWTPDASTPTVPGACVSPLRSAEATGVRFVFGGDSRLVVRAGAVELCGQYSTNAPPITVQGAKTGADPLSGPVTLTTDGTGTNPTNGPAFANPARITATDGSAASAVLDASAYAGGVTASVLLQGFVPPTAIPAGSLLTSAKLVVVHRDNNAGATSRLRLLQISASSSRTGATALTNLPQPTIYQDGPTGTAFHTDTLDITTSLDDEVHAYGLPGFRVRYDAGVAYQNVVTENLDSIRLVLSWRPPAVRGQRTAVNGGANCLAVYPAGCDLLTTEATGSFFLQGTLYAPYASVDLGSGGPVTTGIRSGAVVRALRVRTPAGTVAGPLIEIPFDSAGPVPLEVYFRASVAGRIVATARVRYPATDPTATPAAGRRSVAVLSWTIRRT